MNTATLTAQTHTDSVLTLEAVRNRLSRSGPMFGPGWEEQGMPTWLVQQTYDQALNALHCGRISQEAYEAFYFLWCGLVPRLGTYPCQTWGELPDQVQTMVLILVQAHAIVALRSVPSILERLGVTL